jgi:glucosamine--fructose-6-phosphate aminotransferase (isomerizing)
MMPDPAQMTAQPPTTDSAMYQTMHRQPDDLATLNKRNWEPAREAASLLEACSRVWLVGIGTSFHAALVGEWLFRAAGKDARAVNSFDFATYSEIYPLTESDGVVVMAHTGTKSYSGLALERATAQKATVVSVGSTTAEHPGSRLILRTVEKERSAAYTASHTAAMFALAQLATELSDGARVGSGDKWRAALDSLPALVQSVLTRHDEVRTVAELAAFKRMYATGAGPNAATALEAVIKVREASTGNIDGLPLEQFLHGPIVSANEGDVAVVVNVKGSNEMTRTRTGEIAGVLGRIGAHLWLVGSGVAEVEGAMVFDLPELPEEISPLLAVVPVQMLAYELAVARKANPDRFRRDDPKYAEAISIRL